MVSRRIKGEAAPAAAKVEHALARQDAQIAAQILELRGPGRRQIILALFEIGAGVDHPRIEPELEKRVRPIVVKRDRLPVPRAGMQRIREVPQPPPAFAGRRRYRPTRDVEPGSQQFPIHSSARRQRIGQLHAAPRLPTTSTSPRRNASASVRSSGARAAVHVHPGASALSTQLAAGRPATALHRAIGKIHFPAERPQKGIRKTDLLRRFQQ